MTQNIKYMLLATLLLTASMISCNPDELNPDLPNVEFVVIDGDTVRTRKENNFGIVNDKTPNRNLRSVIGDTIVMYKKPFLHKQPRTKPNLNVLKNNIDPDLKGKPLRMIAIGGSLTAGVRDGGYFNEGIETSYPNLIARQMGIEFKNHTLGQTITMVQGEKY